MKVQSIFFLCELLLYDRNEKIIIVMWSFSERLTYLHYKHL